MSLQTPLSVLRSNNGAGGLVRGGSIMSRRAFTMSSSRRRESAIPTFAIPTSSKTLDDLLLRFRTKVFIPASLYEAQQKLIYRASNRKLLSQSPIVVEVGDEKISLESIDRLNDEPNTKQGIATLLSLMKQPSDWDNLLPFLSGLQNARRRLKANVCCKVARKAIEAGRADVIVECARQVKKTGFNLSRDGLVRQILLSLRETAITSDWEEQATAKALSQTEAIVSLLESSSHSGFEKGQPGDPRTSPEIMGVVLELAAVKAARYPAAEDESTQVHRYAQRLQAMLRTPDKIDELWKDAPAAGNAVAKEMLLSILPVWNAVVYAEKVLERDQEFKNWSRQTREALLPIIDALYETVSKDLTASGTPRYRKAVESYQKTMEASA